MSGFQSVAKSLISRTVDAPPIRKGDSVAGKFDHIKAACDAGFAPSEIFRDLRELADDCTDEEKSVKKSILELMIKVHGMLTPDDLQRVAPQFTLVIQGDNTRVNTMLCPTFGVQQTLFAMGEGK